jgi:hypothetical protein
MHVTHASGCNNSGRHAAPWAEGDNDVTHARLTAAAQLGLFAGAHYAGCFDVVCIVVSIWLVFTAY